MDVIPNKVFIEKIHTNTIIIIVIEMVGMLATIIVDQIIIITTITIIKMGILMDVGLEDTQALKKITTNIDIIQAIEVVGIKATAIVDIKKI
jgi:hypothetical protein